MPFPPTTHRATIRENATLIAFIAAFVLLADSPVNTRALLNNNLPLFKNKYPLLNNTRPLLEKKFYKSLENNGKCC